ncbi:MAG TPA: 2-hydroxyacyl-CoA dehydratase [Firmicutes bacterium]|nr:2-hydroxyacyl-CoA dehydratase [Candidatus Fermentithermobacillaceae bacterium]
MRWERFPAFLPLVLKSKLTYRVAGLALRYLGGRMSPYQLAAVKGVMSELGDAYSGRKPVIFTSAFVPTEIVYGLGAVPYLPEMWSGFAAAFGVSVRGIDESEAKGYSQDLCSFHRCHLGLEELSLLPKPSAIIVSSHLCDGGRRSLYAHSVSTGCPFYVVDVPYLMTDSSVRWLSCQVERICEDISRRVPGLSLDGMARAIENSNRARKIYLDVCQLRRNKPAPWSGSEALNYVFAFLSGWGSEWLVDFYANLGKTLKQRIEQSNYPVPQERLRLLWLNLKPYYGSPLFQYLAQWGVSVAFEEYSYVYWPEMHERRWAEGVATKMLSNFGWGPIERRLDAVWNMVNDYGVDGVVQFDQWGCRQSNGGARVLADFLREKGIPFLELDGDGVDPRNSSVAQALTRLQAFIEVMDARG